MLFSRAATDGTFVDCSYLANSYAGAVPAAAWIIGAGPSLKQAPVELINRSPAPKMCINFSGRDKDGSPPLIHPDFWTSFDPNPRFHKSIYLSPRCIKFVSRGFHMDLVPGTTFKMCDCPGMYFIERESRGYGNFLDPSVDTILNARDSFCQAVDILFRLGFRRLYCVGCDFIIRPSETQLNVARWHGVTYDKLTGCVAAKHNNRERQSDRLRDFVTACREAGVAATDADVYKRFDEAEFDREAQYSFSEQKPFRDAVSTDWHYWWVIQQLRQARMSFSTNGLRLISCTPCSRLNTYFPFITPVAACNEIVRRYGDPSDEDTYGRYQGKHPLPDEGYPLMIDESPWDWEKTKAKRQSVACKQVGQIQPQIIQDVQPDFRVDIKNRFAAYMQNGGAKIDEVG